MKFLFLFFKSTCWFINLLKVRIFDFFYGFVNSGIIFSIRLQRTEQTVVLHQCCIYIGNRMTEKQFNPDFHIVLQIFGCWIVIKSIFYTIKAVWIILFFICFQIIAHHLLNRCQLIGCQIITVIHQITRGLLYRHCQHCSGRNIAAAIFILQPCHIHPSCTQWYDQWCQNQYCTDNFLLTATQQVSLIYCQKEDDHRYDIDSILSKKSAQNSTDCKYRMTPFLQIFLFFKQIPCQLIHQQQKSYTVGNISKQCCWITCKYRNYRKRNKCSCLKISWKFQFFHRRNCMSKNQKHHQCLYQAQQK